MIYVVETLVFHAYSNEENVSACASEGIGLLVSPVP